RRFHSAVLASVVDDAGASAETVVIFGGEDEEGPLASGLFFVIANEAMMIHPSSLPKGARTQLTGTHVDSQGYIYFIGGYTQTAHTAASSAIDIYNTQAADWQQPFLLGVDGFNLLTPRGGHSTSLVGDKMLVTLGGSDGTGPMNRVEVIHEYLEMNEATGTATPKIDLIYSCFEADCSSPVPAMPDARVDHRALVTSWGDVLVVGGAGTASTLVQGLSVYTPQ
ncbi:MAG: hypothetical protein QF464_12515, partial [Myxococcota bacterium]|nr:hypothetical protein [Myxococcota bacterium]